MTVRAYDHYMHTGSYATGSSTLMDNLHMVVKHCLVYGTGGVPGAGWGIELDEGEPHGTLVLSNEDRDFFICFSRESSIAVKVSIAATFEGVDANGFIVGEAARSGASAGFAEPVTLSASYFGGGYNTSSGGRSGWSMLADGDTCSIVFSAAGTSVAAGPGLDATPSSVQRYGGGFSFGKTTKGVGYIAGTAGNTYYAHPADGITVLNYPQTGFLIPSIDSVPSIVAGVLGRYNGAASSATGSLAPFSYEDQSILPIEVYMQGSDTVGAGSLGRIRGFVQMPFVDKSLFPRHLLKSLGMAEDDFDTMRIQDLSKFRVGSDGYRYAYGKLANGNTSLAQMFLTDNPLVW